MNTWEYIPFRAATHQADDLNNLTDKYGLNRSTALRILFRYAYDNRSDKRLIKALKDAAEHEPGSGPRGNLRKDKRK